MARHVAARGLIDLASSPRRPTIGGRTGDSWNQSVTETGRPARWALVPFTWSALSSPGASVLHFAPPFCTWRSAAHLAGPGRAAG